MLVAALALVTLWPAMAAAQVPVCGNGEPQSWLAACTDIIENPRESLANRVRALKFRGLANYRSGDVARAVADFSEATRLAPQDAEAWNNLGMMRQTRGDLDGAIANYDKAIALDPNAWSVHVNRGNALRLKRDPAGAIAAYDRALALKADLGSALVGRGSALRLLGYADRALADYEEATHVAPDNASAWLDRGAVLMQKGSIAEAIASFDKTIALNPQSVEAYNNRGAAQSQNGDFARAAADLDNALRLGPNSEEAYGNRAFVRLALGDFAGAAADFDELAQRNPTDPYRVLWRHLARLRAGLADEGFARDAARFPPDPWPAPLLALYAGSLEREKILALGLPVEPAERRERRCETAFYVGEHALTRNDRSGAAALIREAAENCPIGFLERAAAIGELKRLQP